jgi:hypothetical protein
MFLRQTKKIRINKQKILKVKPNELQNNKSRWSCNLCSAEQGLLPGEQEAKATKTFQKADNVIGFETKMTDACASGRIKVRVILEREKGMESKGNKVIWALTIIAAIAVLVFVPMLKGVMEGVSARAQSDATFGFGIVTLIALLIFGCVAVIAQNLRR